MVCMISSLIAALEFGVLRVVGAFMSSPLYGIRMLLVAFLALVMQRRLSLGVLIRVLFDVLFCLSARSLEFLLLLLLIMSIFVVIFACLLAVLGIYFCCCVCSLCLACLLAVCRWVCSLGGSWFAAAAGRPRSCPAPRPAPTAAGVPVVRGVLPFRSVPQAVALPLSPSADVSVVGGSTADNALRGGSAAAKWCVLFLSTGLVVHCQCYWSAVRYSSECGGAVVDVSTPFGATLLCRCRSLWMS